MNPFAVILAICSLATSHARPGYDHGGGGTQQLMGVPDASHFSKLSYPKFDVLELGSDIKGHLPPTIVTINKKEIIKEPQPYPVKYPVPVPHPYPVAKPYPVVQTKIIKVPQPYPVEVVKKVAIPYEVPKPYPVSHEELQGGGQGGGQSWGGQQSFGGSFGGHEGVDSGDQGGYGGGFEGSEHAGGYAQADQSSDYGAQVQGQWTPLGEQGQGEVEQTEQQQH